MVKGRNFSERLKAIMQKYRDGLVDSAESLDKFAGMVNEEDAPYTSGEDTDQSSLEYQLEITRQALIDLAKETVALEDENEELGLSRAELAFYHAISNPDKIDDFYTHEELVELTKELTETISEEMTQDWAKRESGRANVRRVIKRLLKKHKYTHEIFPKTTFS